MWNFVIRMLLKVFLFRMKMVCVVNLLCMMFRMLCFLKVEGLILVRKLLKVLERCGSRCLILGWCVVLVFSLMVMISVCVVGFDRFSMIWGILINCICGNLGVGVFLCLVVISDMGD